MPITLSSLKIGLAALKNDAQPLIDELKTKLTSGISITDEEEKWRDHEANFTDETLLLAELQHAMDFQSALDSLSNNQRAIAQCMQAASGVESQNLGMVANVVRCESNPNLKRSQRVVPDPDEEPSAKKQLSYPYNSRPPCLILDLHLLQSSTSSTTSSPCWLLQAHSTSGSNTMSNTTSSLTLVYSGSNPNLVPSRPELVMLHTSGSRLLYQNPIAPLPPELQSHLYPQTLTSSSVLSPCILYCISFIMSSQYSGL
ncbi:uncharacterized protein EI90DRAFT_3127019 [Cantharellus anzutake]|uniref:uncharacterized protein n=1 Tax=Cantharellus anzutake TaxID=1750568 RepID=UPI0019082F84|nr:uncharacterized protein EI90DRAFT_3127019 [Cantharellus anzutake]KAF8327375.1 hypothetical protein EI90DRAFT_3127019 [Cantharellus anzutake]